MNRGTPNGLGRTADDAQEGPTCGPRSPSPAASGAEQAVDVDQHLRGKMAAIRRVLGQSVLAPDSASEQWQF
jgi:hypothetical protein